MKIALCLSGQPRKALETFPFIKQYIINSNKYIGDTVDVFIHMNYDNNNTYIEKSHLDSGECHLKKDIDKELINLYQPQDYLVEKHRSFYNPNLKIPESRIKNYLQMNKHKNLNEEAVKKHIIKQLLSCYYSIYKCNELKEKYANDNHFVYDYVIRMRFDAVPQLPLICRNFNPDYIYYQEMGHKDDLISDWLNFGSNSIMNIYSSIFLHIEYINSFKFYKKKDRNENTLEPSDECGGLYEHTIRDLFHFFKIPKKPFNIHLKLLY